jgi:hypothetical protein
VGLEPIQLLFDMAYAGGDSMSTVLVHFGFDCDMLLKQELQMTYCTAVSSPVMPRGESKQV